MIAERPGIGGPNLESGGRGRENEGGHDLVIVIEVDVVQMIDTIQVHGRDIAAHDRRGGVDREVQSIAALTMVLDHHITRKVAKKVIPEVLTAGEVGRGVHVARIVIPIVKKRRKDQKRHCRGLNLDQNPGPNPGLNPGPNPCLNPGPNPGPNLHKRKKKRVEGVDQGAEGRLKGVKGTTNDLQVGVVRSASREQEGTLQVTPKRRNLHLLMAIL